MVQRAKQARSPKRRRFQRGETPMFLVCEAGVFGISGWLNLALKGMIRYAARVADVPADGQITLTVG